MDISSFFEPIDIGKIGYKRGNFVPRLGDFVVSYNKDGGRFPIVNEKSVVLLGITDGRGSSTNLNCANAADMVRRYLYPLAAIEDGVKVLDLGNMVQGATIDDSRQALTEVAMELLRQNCIVVTLGGSQDYTWALYRAYAQLGKVMNISAVDPRFDIDEERALDSRNWLRYIIMEQPNYLFNYTNIGYQSYFVGQQYVDLMDELKFDAYRLGWVRENLVRSEPLLRNADCVSIDVGAIRQSDAPATTDPSPHGFYGEEMCQLVRFAGMSDKTSSIGFFDFSPMHDNSGQTAHLLAHALWYFIEGVGKRKQDNPYKDTENYRKVIVPLEEHGVEVIFYKSKKSDRWWVEIPYATDTHGDTKRKLLVPCLYDDYEQALQNKIPDLWWKFYQRVNS